MTKTTKGKIQKFIHAVRYKLSLDTGWVKHSLAGKTLEVRYGTLHDRADYDEAWFCALAKKSNIIMDVGSNVGGNVLLALASNPSARVFAVEANPLALKVSIENVMRNSLIERVQFIEKFAGDSDNAEISFWTVGTSASASRYQEHAETAAREKSCRQVQSITLDSMCSFYGVTPDLVKIDVEGAEEEVLKGCKQISSYMKTTYLVEMHSNPDLTMYENTRRILEWCREVNYAAWYLTFKILIDEPSQAEKRGRCHFLLLPQGQKLPPELATINQSDSVDSVLY